MEFDDGDQSISDITEQRTLNKKAIIPMINICF